MKIAGIQKTTLVDYPGRVSCTVFVAGCNFRCPFCHNPSLVLPESVEKSEFLSEKEIFNFLEKRKDCLEGVCITGGEPTISPGIVDFCRRVKEKGYLVKIDSNGTNPEILSELIRDNLLDYAAVDIKSPKKKYASLSGLEEGLIEQVLLKIEETINLLKNSGIQYEFRTTVVPSFLDKEDILEISRWIAPADKYVLQNFRPLDTLDPKLKKVKPYPDSFFLQIKEELKPFFKEVEIRR